MPYQAQLDRPLQLSPGRQVALGIERSRMRIARSDIDARRMMVREWPVDQIQVQVVEAQVGQRAPERRQDVVGRMPIVPQLGRDPELVACHAARLDALEGDADLSLVPVDGCAVEVPVAQGRGDQHRIRDGRGAGMVGTEGAEADGGHRGAGPQAAPGHQSRVDAVAG